MIEIGIAGIGVLGPGLEGWDECARVLRGEAAYAPRPLAVPPPPLLHERERRRTAPAVRLALAAAYEATQHAGIPIDELAIVFGSANGDGKTLDSLLRALMRLETPVSPTQFHNSVHNVATGYWTIGALSHRPATSIAAHDFTFGAALLKAVAQVAAEAAPVLLAVYDMPFPEPLHERRPIGGPFAVSLVLVPADAPRLCRLRLDWRSGSGGDTLRAEPPLDAVTRSNPAARALPLLAAIAAQRGASLFLQHTDGGGIALEVRPDPTCP